MKATETKEVVEKGKPETSVNCGKINISKIKKYANVTFFFEVIPGPDHVLNCNLKCLCTKYYVEDLLK